MSRLRLQISMSLDGCVAGPGQSVDEPLGRDGERLHEWAFPTRTFNRVHGRSGGETGPDDGVLSEAFESLGATIMGRHMFGPDRGPWGDDPWRGWWGENPPYHHSVFVLTHHAREPLEMEGGTTFHFVTEGIEAALERARDAAGGMDVSLGGGADVVNQYLAAGFVDVMEIHLVPVLLGDGARLFAGTGDALAGFELDRVIHTGKASHFRYEKRG